MYRSPDPPKVTSPKKWEMTSEEKGRTIVHCWFLFIASMFLLIGDLSRVFLMFGTWIGCMFSFWLAKKTKVR